MAPLSFDEQARKAIPSQVHMISGSMDSQTSSDVFNVGSFQVSFELEWTSGFLFEALSSALLSNQFFG